MKVYIVTNGSYSDYHIVKVFLDKEKAHDFANRATTSGYDQDYDVEEYDTEDDADINLLPFEVRLRRDGAWNVFYTEYCLKEAKANKFDYSSEIDNIVEGEETITIGDTTYRKDKENLTDSISEKNVVKRPEYATFWLMAKDPQSALKIAHERYGAIKAMGNVFDPTKYYTFPSYKEYVDND